MSTIENYHRDIIQDTKKHIIEIARDLFSEFSYLGVSMDDIAKKLNITKAALYYHFTGKEELYMEVLDEVIRDLSLSIEKVSNEKTASKKLHKLIKSYLDFGYKEKNLIKVLIIKFPFSNSRMMKYLLLVREEISNLIETEIKKIFAENNLHEKINSHTAAFLLTSLMDGLLLDYSFLNKKIDSKIVSNQIVEILFKK